jgi:hypothetical protein
MMGRKTLGEIHEDFKRAIKSETGEDPIVWVKKRIAAANRRGGQTDVLESI